MERIKKGEDKKFERKNAEFGTKKSTTEQIFILSNILSRQMSRSEFVCPLCRL